MTVLKNYIYEYIQNKSMKKALQPASVDVVPNNETDLGQEDRNLGWSSLGQLWRNPHAQTEQSWESNLC